MKLLVLEASTCARRLSETLTSAARQECDALTILVVHREGSSVDGALLDAVRVRYALDITTIQLREDDGLGTLLRLVRKRYKAAEDITVAFADERLDNPHALRRMHSALEAGPSYAVCGWTARDGSALRSATVRQGAIPSFRAAGIDGLAVAALDALDACEGEDRRAALAESLSTEDAAIFVDELLVARDTASVALRVELSHAAPAVPRSADATSSSSPSAVPTGQQSQVEPQVDPQVEQEQRGHLDGQLDDEPLLAHALESGFGGSVAGGAPQAAPAAPTPSFAPTSPVEEDVSDLLRGLSGDDADPTPTPAPSAVPADRPETLDAEAKALLQELASEGRLDFAELEASLSKDDPDAIAFVARLANIPDDLRERLRALFVEAGGDPALFGDEDGSSTLSMDDADTAGMDDETKAMLEAAISGPANLSWQDEVVEEGAKSTPEADDTPNEPSPEAVDSALASLQKLEEKLEQKLEHKLEQKNEDDEPKGALDSFFEDYENENVDDPETGDGDKVSALDSFFAEEFDDGPSQDGDSAQASVSAGAPVDNSFEGLCLRARKLAARVAENLVSRQQANGEFDENERYAKECAAALWKQLDQATYRAPIQRALDASRRRAEALALQNHDDGQGPLRAYALSAVGFTDNSRFQLDDARSIDTLAEATLRSRRGQVIDVKRISHIKQAYESSGALFDRWMPEDPNASPLSARDQALAAVLIGEVALRTPKNLDFSGFGRQVEDRLITIARSGAMNGMFTAGAAYRAAERRGEESVMRSILERYEDADLAANGSSAADGHCESLAFFGLQLSAELATLEAEAHA